ncbi:MAG: cytidine deaminase [Candidatus Neomarinimicrobiota bacterium]|nr:MAG: cytidine deaminase [Candidatus Neomarinimicrobiota bacterium]
MDLKSKLVHIAQDMRQRSRAPYSQYRVGAAVATADGAVIGGCNVENASYSLTCCAERVALFRAVAEGHRHFQALAVATEDGGSPCGACRQVMWELCGEIPVYLVDGKGAVRETTSGRLLPAAFDADSLSSPT